ncbi:cell division ATPase MinD [Methanococcus voltae]|jgi:septum site-determining protein MinD|uniref:Septum site-determining protein MinD n=2 Tax=Methanococcus voltae TaxID=2188 RepID=A0A8J7RMC6_METVO|nr:cell division ATPase MinD [Methanococcus voltae]MBP2172562.1 septum site-determining protein MinD [Methanococcus voltae]MBP2201531.1 septum site-determining protein MinD [Methanococcus voltae]MCS3922320.1 septum site-determining protein MinD [Methanococcus voltae PS]
MNLVDSKKNEAIKIAMVSGKGGTGKSTICANLALALSKYGKDVVVVDTDVNMANLELIVGMEGMPITLNSVIAGNADITQAIYEYSENMRVVPAGVSLDELKFDNSAELEIIIERLDSMCEVLLIDCPAGLNQDVNSIISSADHVIVIVTPDITSVSDAIKLINLSTKLETSVLGAVVNKVTNDSSELTTKAIETILELPVVASVPQDDTVRANAAYGVLSVEKQPESGLSNSIMELAAKLTGNRYIPQKGPSSSLVDKIKRLFKR